MFGAFIVADQFAATFKDFPIIQKPNSFTIEEAIKKLSEPGGR